MKIKPTHDQKEIVMAVLDGESIFLESVAGSGKTTILCLIDHFLKNVDFLVLSFSKELTLDINEKMTYGWSSTLHAFLMDACHNFLQANGIKAGVKKVGKKFYRGKAARLRENQIDFLLRKELLRIYGVEHTKKLDAQQNSSYWVNFFQCKDLITSIRNQCFDYRLPETIIECYKGTYGQDLINVAINTLQVMTEHFFNRGEYDFQGALYIPCLFPEIHPYIPNPQIVAIDEVNDSNKLFRTCYGLIAKNQVILVGDTNQTIHIWNGTEPNCTELISKQFDCTKFSYSTTFRAPKVVVEWLNDSGLNEDIKPFATNSTGEINTLSYNKMLLSIQPKETILGRFNRSKKDKSLHEINIELIQLGKRTRLLGSDHIEVCSKMLTYFNPLSNVPVLQQVELGMKATIEEIRQEKMKPDTAAERKLLTDFDTFSLYWNFYQTKSLGKPTEFIEFLYKMQDNSETAITLCSMHRSKGKEWQSVYLTSVDYLMSVISDENIPLPERIEARNLFYVACTRTKEKLNIVGTELPTIVPKL